MGSFNLAAVIGSACGTVALAVWPLAEARALPEHAEELAYALWWGAVFAVAAFPFVAIGLAVFGLPVALALRRHIARPAVGLLAVLWGGLAGKLAFAALANRLFGELFEPLTLQSPDLGLCYGLSTALAWWWLERRRRLGRAGEP